jgi:hypothetical protein
MLEPRASDGDALRMCIPYKVATNGLGAVALLWGLKQVIVECILLEMLRTRSALDLFFKFVILPYI